MTWLRSDMANESYVSDRTHMWHGVNTGVCQCCTLAYASVSHVTYESCHIWVMLHMSHATYESRSIWVMLHMSHVTHESRYSSWVAYESCHIWVMSHRSIRVALSHVTYESCHIWVYESHTLRTSNQYVPYVLQCVCVAADVTCWICRVILNL